MISTLIAVLTAPVVIGYSFDKIIEAAPGPYRSWLELARVVVLQLQEASRNK